MCHLNEIHNQNLSKYIKITHMLEKQGWTILAGLKKILLHIHASKPGINMINGEPRRGVINWH